MDREDEILRPHGVTNVSNTQATTGAKDKAVQGKAPAGATGNKMERSSLPEGFTKVSTEDNMFNPRSGVLAGTTTVHDGKDAVQGWLLDIVRLKEEALDEKTGKMRKAFDVLAIKLTQPSYASREIEGGVPDDNGDKPLEKILVPAGEVLLVPAWFTLVKAFGENHQDPKFVYEIYLKPTKKVPVPKAKEAGSKMWKFDTAMAGKAERLQIAPNTVAKKFALSQGQAAPVKQLGAAPAASDASTPDWVNED